MPKHRYKKQNVWQTSLASSIDLKAQLSNRDKLIGEMHAKSATAKSLHDNDNARLGEAEIRLRELDAVRSQNTTLRADLGTCKARLHSSESEIRQLRQSSSGLRQELQAATSRAETLQEQLSKIQQEQQLVEERLQQS